MNLLISKRAGFGHRQRECSSAIARVEDGRLRQDLEGMQESEKGNHETRDWPEFLALTARRSSLTRSSTRVHKSEKPVRDSHLQSCW
jgi:hypothetical protein